MTTNSKSPEEVRKAKLIMLAMILPLSLLMIWLFASEQNPFEGMNGIEAILFLFGAFFIVSWTLTILYTSIRNTDPEETERVFKSYESLIFKGPLFLIILGIIGIVLVAFVGFLASIPLWAAIIIILLLIR